MKWINWGFSTYFLLWLLGLLSPNIAENCWDWLGSKYSQVSGRFICIITHSFSVQKIRLLLMAKLCFMRYDGWQISTWKDISWWERCAMTPKWGFQSAELMTQAMISDNENFMSQAYLIFWCIYLNVINPALVSSRFKFWTKFMS